MINVKFKKIIKQLLKFGVVGGIAFLIDYSLLYVFTEFFGLHYLISSVFSFVISFIFNYLASVKWVFETDKHSKKLLQIIIFLVFSLIGLGINQLGMYFMVEKIKVYYMISKIFVTIIVMIWNFITRKLFLERRHNEKSFNNNSGLQ